MLKNTQPQYVIANSELDTIIDNFEFMNGNKTMFYKKLEKGLSEFKENLKTK